MEEDKQPPGWTKDSLSDFFQATHECQYATFHHKRKLFQKLQELDAAFQTIMQNLHNPKGLIEPLLFIRCHAAFRAASGLACATQIPESFTLMRSALEYAGYALLIFKDPSLAEVWVRRHDDEATMKAQKKAFIMGNITNVMASYDRKLSATYTDLYERTINMGGHPNEQAVTQGLKMTREEGSLNMKQAYLPGDGLHLDHAVRTVAQVGVGCLIIFQIIYRTRYDLLRLSEKLDKLKQGL